MNILPCLLQERFYFGDTVLPLFESGIPLARKKLRSLPDADNITIAYPDEGSWKRFHYQFGDYPEVTYFLDLVQTCVEVNNIMMHPNEAFGLDLTASWVIVLGKLVLCMACVLYSMLQQTNPMPT